MSEQIAFATVGGSTARFSDCGAYRYELARRWSHGPAVCWIMLNPSTADASEDDPTIRRCIGFSKAWNCGSLVVVNLFAFRSTDPGALRTAARPIGAENDDVIHDAVVRSRVVVAAWGVHGTLHGRAPDVEHLVADLGRDLLCLGTTKDGHPRHPLYVKGDTRPTPLRKDRTVTERIEGVPGSYPLDHHADVMAAREYRKTATVRAAQLPGDAVIVTPEGEMQARAGDYLAQHEDGHAWPIKRETFEQTYEATE